VEALSGRIVLGEGVWKGKGNEEAEARAAAARMEESL
jgi:hypothetical protein